MAENSNNTENPNEPEYPSTNPKEKVNPPIKKSITDPQLTRRDVTRDETSANRSQSLTSRPKAVWPCPADPGTSGGPMGPSFPTAASSISASRPGGSNGMSGFGSYNSLTDVVKRFCDLFVGNRSTTRLSGSTGSHSIRRGKKLFKFLPGEKVKEKKRQVVLTYAQSQRPPRQPFRNTAHARNNANQAPAPPSYYTNSVPRQQPYQYQQQTDQQRDTTQSDNRSVRSDRQSEASTPAHNQPQARQWDTRPNDPNTRGEVRWAPMAMNYQPGGMIYMPSMALNMSYWAPYPDSIPADVPACLAHLCAASSLFIVQQLDMLELFMDIEEPNYYLIQNSSGECLYYAYESSTLFMQSCCPKIRGFQLHVMDMYHNEIIYLNKACGCNNCCCCYPVLEVYSPPLVPVGAITQVCNVRAAEFAVLDADENRIFTIYGPNCCVMSCCAEVDFTIHAMDKEQTEIGVIRRHFMSTVRTLFTDADAFGITFPRDLDVRIKAIFLGALFFIDYTFYEGN